MTAKEHHDEPIMPPPLAITIVIGNNDMPHSIGDFLNGIEAVRYAFERNGNVTDVQIAKALKMYADMMMEDAT